MESKDGVHAASRQWISDQRSPHRTSTSQHIRRSNSGCFPHAPVPLVSGSILLPVRDSSCPECLDPLPKPGCRHPDSATKPDMNVSVHPAPQQRGACHAYLGNQSPWLFSYRDNVDVTGGDCLSHRSLLAFWAGCDRLRCCHHP